MKSDPTLAPSRRGLLTNAGIGAVALGAMAAGVSKPAQAADLDVAILNFALNLEFLEAEFYLFAATGEGLPRSLTASTGPAGSVKGGKKLNPSNEYIKALLGNIARDEFRHVEFLVGSLGKAAIAQPQIDFTDAFLAIGNLVGVSGFDPFSNQLHFLAAAYLFEDVGVTAYSGAAPLVTSKTYLAAAAGILSVEAYHAGAIRALLYETGMTELTDRISALRAKLSGTGPAFGIPADDYGLSNGIAPTNTSSIAFARTPSQVLSIVYAGGTTSGGFFPKGVNGTFTTA